MTSLAFLDADPAHAGFQYLEDLATAYWYSEVLFTALNLKLFDHLQSDTKTPAMLASETHCDQIALQRLLRALAQLELVGEYTGKWFNCQAAQKYLVSTSRNYLGDFLLYRQYMKAGWEKLLNRVSGDVPARGPAVLKDDEAYHLRNFRYVQAMDALARVKAEEILPILAQTHWQSPVLDIGGGAGALCRAIVHSMPGSHGLLFDLPEVIQAARQLYPDKNEWYNIQPIEGDFRTYPFPLNQKFGLVLLGNFLHAYGEWQAQELLAKALSLLSPQGIVVVHDYFPDSATSSPQKGALYDLNMMLNTYNGVCHTNEKVTGWLKQNGMVTIWQRELASDSSLIIAGGPEAQLEPQSNDPWPQTAKLLGFRKAVVVNTDTIVVAAWVRLKCRNGCSNYGRNLQCPPHSMQPEQMRQLLKSYQRGVLVEGVPPGKEFHERLLALERQAFLSGYHKAVAFGAGPCRVCHVCPEKGPCRNSKKARPSMEAVGVDVYETVRKAGFSIHPVLEKGGYVKYFGLLMLE